MTYESHALVGWGIVALVVLGIAWAIAWGSVRVNHDKLEGGYRTTTTYEKVYGQ